MYFYAIIFTILLFYSGKKYQKYISLYPHLIIMAMIAMQGEVGPDYFGYLNRYLNFNVNETFQKSNGEIGWYFIEYLTHVNQWGYHMYSMFAGIIGIGFLLKAQNNIKFFGFLVIIFQQILIQLGLSGLRQFVAVCILIYASSIYFFSSQKSVYKFLFLIVLGATFHVSVLVMGFILIFILKLKTRQTLFLIILSVVALAFDISASVLANTVDKYDVRYLQGTRFSSGAWVRFSITIIIIVMGIYKNTANKELFFLGITIIILGTSLGLVNSIALHRLNYYFLPVGSLILVKNYRFGTVSRMRMRFVYIMSICYFIIWFGFSKYADSFIPYTFFFN